MTGWACYRFSKMKSFLCILGVSLQ
jgi:hypothetical protein